MIDSSSLINDSFCHSTLLMDGWMTCFYVLFNSFSVISGQWEGDNERVFAMFLFKVDRISTLFDSFYTDSYFGKESVTKL